jgi:hypothetical protein
LHGHDEKFIAFQRWRASFGIDRDGYYRTAERQCAGRRDAILQRHRGRVIEHFRNMAGERRARRQRRHWHN